MSGVELGFLIGGWVAAAAGWALWLAERGRVRDLRWLTQLEQEHRTAAVVARGTGEEEARRIIDEEGLDRLATDIQERAGVDPKEALEEAKRMVAEVQRLGGGW